MAVPVTAGGSLGVKGLTFVYKTGESPVFEGLDFSVDDGEFVSILGPSGCGKSTLLRLVGGLLDAETGTVTVGGVPVSGPSPSIGVVFQADTLLPWRTALKNVGLGLEDRLARGEIRERSLAMLELVGLAGAESRYPHQLSGGMRQRVNLARALVTDPQVLLLDEPFAALDAQTRERQQEHLLEVWEREHKTVVFVTHDIEEAVFLADRVIVLGLPPAGIVMDVEVTIPRPRDMKVKAGAEYRETVEALRDVIRGLHAG